MWPWLKDPEAKKKGTKEPDKIERNCYDELQGSKKGVSECQSKDFDYELGKKMDEPKLLKVTSTELKQDDNRKEIISILGSMLD